MSYNSGKNQSSYPITLLKAVGFSVITSIIFVIILAVILTFTSLSEGIIPVINSIIMIVSIAFGAIYVSLKSDRMGWLNGAGVGLIYILIIMILGAIFVDSFDIDIYLLFRIIVALITGSIAGMIGINLR
ncbi:TIGR04086 family membrane protein [Sporosalibacterium faouarense]|uniref:TIGR04086 family membrane protein n=1 Tax=Sporosalibacterium faouarense TaxID=516123 RepID=UPI00141D3179|nr:TIGR04086 family membrane protein [Sporosalibacterium faouarense]MTI47791.1 TIGR04086 family membrane protein [Bacillota bacterium]